MGRASYLLQNASPPGMFSFVCQKRTRKAPATFEAREARIKGYSPLIIPKKMGSIQKNPSRFARGFFVFRRFRVACATCRADKLVHFLLRECSRRESAAVDAVYHYDLPCEKANQENPQIFLICRYKNNFSDEFATATTAACGRNREELLGPWPAGCKARSRAVAAAGCHNSSRAKRRQF